MNLGRTFTTAETPEMVRRRIGEYLERAGYKPVGPAPAFVYTRGSRLGSMTGFSPRKWGVRTNLQLLQRGITPTGRRALAEASGLPETVITELVNRADFSRLPWASKATISNIIGAGYGSLVQLANADAEKLYADFFTYGESIGKNLKLGNEIENSYRIARIVPALVRVNLPHVEYSPANTR
jgi:hypothetical protein